MRPSEIVMTLCDIDEYSKTNRLTKGQKSYRTKLINELRKHRLSILKNEFKRSIKDFFTPINYRSVYRNDKYSIKYRKDCVIYFRQKRLEINNF